MENNRREIAAVGGVVYRRTLQGQLEFLLIKKRGGFWTLPKGRIKADENPITAVQREVFEETGIAGAVDRIHRHRVRNVAHQASTILQYASMEQ
jgi:8-oxo-dGTP pyrophosphatase MutT (NUDIX family)